MTNVHPPQISQLKELPVPAPDFSYLPHTWGWAVLAAGLVIAGAAVYWRRRTRWQHDQYRRDALAALEWMELQLENPDQRPHALRGLPELLKRVALSMSVEPGVESLHGEQWQVFLQRHVSHTLPEDFATQLATLAYQPSGRLAPPQQQALLKLCRQWIEVHHVAI